MTFDFDVKAFDVIIFDVKMTHYTYVDLFFDVLGFQL